MREREARGQDCARNDAAVHCHNDDDDEDSERRATKYRMNVMHALAREQQQSSPRLTRVRRVRLRHSLVCLCLHAFATTSRETDPRKGLKHVVLLQKLTGDEQTSADFALPSSVFPTSRAELSKQNQMQS